MSNLFFFRKQDEYNIHLKVNILEIIKPASRYQWLGRSCILAGECVLVSDLTYRADFMRRPWRSRWKVHDLPSY